MLTLAYEIDDVSRLASAGKLVGYSGLPANVPTEMPMTAPPAASMNDTDVAASHNACGSYRRSVMRR